MKAIFDQLTNTYSNNARGRHAANADFDCVARSFGFNTASDYGLMNEEGKHVDFELELEGERLVIKPLYFVKVGSFIVTPDDVLDLVVDGEISIYELRNAITNLPNFNSSYSGSQYLEDKVLGILGKF